MKFLCVPCDQPMTLAQVAPPDRGSLTVRYACPACGYEMAMLTNPYETQLVASLGVRIGSEALDPAAQGAACPAATRLAKTVGDGEEAQLSGSAGTGSPGMPDPQSGGGPLLTWTPQAEARLANIPPFVRPMARMGIERFARERGRERVDEAVLDEARAFFGM